MMGKGWTRKCLCLAAAAAVLAAGPAVGRAMAYFTANAQASGGVTLNMNFTEIIPEEEIVNREKQISITNMGAVECYVRVKVLTGAAYQELLTYKYAPEAWEQQGDDGYFYYKEIVPPEGRTDTLFAGLVGVEAEALENGLEDFNVIVAAECTPVLYHEDGSPYADWDADTGWNASPEQTPEIVGE